MDIPAIDHRSGPNPTDRGKTASKHHALTDRRGTSIVVRTTAACVNGGTMLIELVDAIPLVRGRVGAPGRRPWAVVADKAYRSRERITRLWILGITPMPPRRGE